MLGCVYTRIRRYIYDKFDAMNDMVLWLTACMPFVASPRGAFYCCEMSFNMRRLPHNIINPTSSAFTKIILEIKVKKLSDGFSHRKSCVLAKIIKFIHEADFLNIKAINWNFVSNVAAGRVRQDNEKIKQTEIYAHSAL